MIKPKLKEGEVYCPKCNGHGEILPTSKLCPTSKLLHYYIPATNCDHCSATGKLDWIENIAGKK